MDATADYLSFPYMSDVDASQSSKSAILSQERIGSLIVLTGYSQTYLNAGKLRYYIEIIVTCLNEKEFILDVKMELGNEFAYI